MLSVVVLNVTIENVVAPWSYPSICNTSFTSNEGKNFFSSTYLKLIQFKVDRERKMKFKICRKKSFFFVLKTHFELVSEVSYKTYSYFSF
jgi:hypothetical protein